RRRGRRRPRPSTAPRPREAPAPRRAGGRARSSAPPRGDCSVATVGRRIVVLGASGNGKTTVARTLAERLGVPHVELDALHHGPNWTAASPEELRARVMPYLEGGGWVIDGDYSAKLGDLVLERADTAVWLDQPLPLILWRLWRRAYRRIRRREELWSRNVETWRGAFVGG